MILNPKGKVIYIFKASVQSYQYCNSIEFGFFWLKLKNAKVPIIIYKGEDETDPRNHQPPLFVF